ncbi:Nif3-like dinuclear metal center hexameric protein [bacterium]|nr:Nif3-like dinuclear metal center hexameric protein [bacterium]
MIKLKELEQYLAQFLNTESFSDYCVNGLQIEGKPEINRIITGVSTSARLLETAVKYKADAVIVHHGLFWKYSPHPMTLTGIMRNRVKLLINSDISLLGYHLPLDAHQELGNNALIAKALDLTNLSFRALSDFQQPIGAVGDLKNSLTFSKFKEFADKALETNGLALDFSKNTVNRIYILSGGGGNYFSDAGDSGADIMVTGELKEQAVRAAEEMGLSLYGAGHYNSEKWGIRALGNHLMEKFDLEVKFVDIPNPV